LHIRCCFIGRHLKAWFDYTGIRTTTLDTLYGSGTNLLDASNGHHVDKIDKKQTQNLSYLPRIELQNVADQNS